MAPKKKAKAKGDDDDGGYDQAEMQMILEAKLDSLKQLLVFEKERANLAERKKQDIQSKMKQSEEETKSNEALRQTTV